MKPTPPPINRPPEIPLTFRREIVPHIFRAVRGGWSVALVGVSGVGASNLMRFICEPRVVTDQLGESAARTLLVYLQLAPPFETDHLYQEIVRQIQESARKADWPKADLAAVRSLANQLLAMYSEGRVLLADARKDLS